MVDSSYPGNRALSRPELVELLIIFAAAVVFTALGTWVAGSLDVKVGWRLAAGACGATVVIATARLLYYRQRPTLKWFAAVAAICGLIVIANALADTKLW